ncbi:MAG: hypothetical protein JWQ38_647 [Flavipsychrobacter sp.]|nr:hypothetical protein [Flavipsychrobacter sp.]
MHLIKKSGSSTLSLGFVTIVFAAFLISSCGHRPKKPSPSGFSDDAFIDRLKEVMKPVDTVNKKSIISISDNVRLTYLLDEYQPIWVKENYKPTAAATQLIAELEDMRWDGIEPEVYNLAAIKKLKEKLDTTKKNNVSDAIVFDTMLTHGYLAASKHLLIGMIVPKKVDSLWYHANDSTWNAPQVLADGTGKYQSLEDFRSKVPTYKLLREEYKMYYNLQTDSVFNAALAGVAPVKNPDPDMMGNIHSIISTEMPWLNTAPNDSISEEKQLIVGYQQYAGIKQTGKLDSATLAGIATHPDKYMQKIRANMERVRWMQKDFGSLYVIVDVPLAELFLRKEGGNAMHMRVVVGKPERQTPSLFANMANVVINPPWGVPPTILKNDVVPGFQKDGRKYLSKKGLKAYDKKGNLVSSASLNMGNLKKYTYKQDPGDDNSLGVVKFNLPNPWDIYLHDTPHRDDFVKSYRALSSGCVRLEQPQEMALYILSQLEKKRYTQDRLDSVIETHKTRWEVLKNKIPVHIAYLTAFEDASGSHLRFARDVYARDTKLIAAMN